MRATRFIVYMFSIGSLILNRLPAFGMISPLLCLGHSLTKMGKRESRGEEKWRGKTAVKGKAAKMVARLQGIFSPH